MRDTPNGRRWVELLRSNEYRQAMGILKTADSRYCCLGVAYEGVMRRDPGCKLLIPNDELEFMGLDKSDQAHCSVMNDQHNLTFGQIADVLELAMDRELSVENAHQEYERQQHRQVETRLDREDR